MNDREIDQKAATAGKRQSRWIGLRWALAPFLLLGSGLVGLAVMTALAVDDPSFALEKDYYQKALRLDQQQAQEAENRKLGWQLKLEAAPRSASSEPLDLLVTLTGPDGLLDGAEVTVEAFHNARAADVRALAFDSEGEGRYRAQLTGVRPGLWELRFTVQRYGLVFTRVERRMLGGKDES